MSDAMLLAREDVQKELELVDDQFEQLGKLRDNSDMREMFEQLRDLPQEERMAKMRELMETAQTKMKKAVDEILLPHQAERLEATGVQWQMRGGGLAQRRRSREETEHPRRTTREAPHEGP